MNDREFSERLIKVRSDRSSGAAELARSCLAIIAESCRRDNSDSTAKLLQATFNRSALLAGSRPSMAPVTNLLTIFQEVISTLKDLPPAEARRKCVEVAENITATSVKSTEKTAEHAAALIGENRTVFTLSYSSTVLQAFTLLDKKSIKVIVSESRPLYEGYSMAEKLSQLGIPITLITDAQAGLFVERADMVLVGADTILPDFSVLNKAGTYLAALAAQDNNIPFYVCSEKYKQTGSLDKAPELEAMDPAELNAPDLPLVSIENIYFDVTPAKLITGWINEEGILPVGQH